MHPHQGGISHAKHGFAHPARNIAALGITHGMHIADFGAGSGAYVFGIADALAKSGTVYAVDIQKDLLRRIANEATRRNYTNVEVIWGDIEEEGGSKLAPKIDIVLISNMLFQVSDKMGVLREAIRIVKPGGIVAIIDWTESFGGLGPHPDHVVGKDAAYEYARKAGLTFVKEFPAGAHHYGLIFRKSSSHARSA